MAALSSRSLKRRRERESNTTFNGVTDPTPTPKCQRFQRFLDFNRSAPSILQFKTLIAHG